MVEYTIENDMWYKKRKHIYYLGKLGKGREDLICTYSLKTKHLLIKCANEHIPETYILKQFVEYCEKKGEN